LTIAPEPKADPGGATAVPSWIVGVPHLEHRGV